MFILVASVIAGLLLAWLFNLPIATMLLATSPGGLAEMTITAQALKVGVPLVVAFHLFRVIVVNMGTQYIYTFSVWARDALAARREIAKIKKSREIPEDQAPRLTASPLVPPTTPKESE
jgi:exosortase/archaeosortase